MEAVVIGHSRGHGHQTAGKTERQGASAHPIDKWVPPSIRFAKASK
jgi:hypothetical protein